MAYFLDTDAFINALRRFVNHRGKPLFFLKLDRTSLEAVKNLSDRSET